jgi:hypothetical protein
MRLKSTCGVALIVVGFVAATASAGKPTNQKKQPNGGIGAATGALIGVATGHAAEEPVSRQYEVQAKLVDDPEGGGGKAIRLPLLVAVEGEPVQFRDSMLHPKDGPAPGGGVQLRLQVARQGKDQLRVEVDIQRSIVPAAVDGVPLSIQEVALRTVRDVRPGQTFHMELQCDDRGTPKSWLELSVKKVSD